MRAYKDYTLDELLDELTKLGAMSHVFKAAFVPEFMRKEENVKAEIKKRFALLEAHQK